jgi:hypothetical protein
VWYPTFALNRVNFPLDIPQMNAPQRRIDDRIRQLCTRAQSASDRDLEAVLQELLALVHEKGERLKGRAARLLLKGEQLESERRQSFR